MNPKNNKLWIIMKSIINKYYYLTTTLERIKDDKFIEDNEELKKIGLELFNEFNLNENKINFFMDICAAPGLYSKIILDKNNDSTGIGISLPPEKGGVEFIIKDSKYKIFYKDILEKKYELDIPKKVDFGMASCVSFTDDKSKAFILNMELILVSLDLILCNLKKGGNIIINLTLKNMYICYNVINILSKYFKSYKLWKSKTTWGIKNSFYFIGNDYLLEDKCKEDFRKFSEDIKLNKSDLSNFFLGTEDEYKSITKKINKILIIKINAWLNLLETQ